jgi:hypothetical protein
MRQLFQKLRLRPNLNASRSSARFYARKRHLAAAIDPVIGKPDLRYIIEISDLEMVMQTTLKRIYIRDGEKVFKEASCTVRRNLSDWIAATQKYKGWKNTGRGVRRPAVPSIAA